MDWYNTTNCHDTAQLISKYIQNKHGISLKETVPYIDQTLTGFHMYNVNIQCDIFNHSFIILHNITFVVWDSWDGLYFLRARYMTKEQFSEWYLCMNFDADFEKEREMLIAKGEYTAKIPKNIILNNPKIIRVIEHYC